MKICSKCLIEKNLADFYDQPNSQPTKDGKTYWCKACYAENYKRNRKRQLLSNRSAYLKRTYGLSIDEYDALLAQGCTVCGDKARGKIVMDHCHTTNSVRAPLCDRCNVALGCADDDPEILRSLAAYVESHRTM